MHLRVPAASFPLSEANVSRVSFLLHQDFNPGEKNLFSFFFLRLPVIVAAFLRPPETHFVSFACCYTVKARQRTLLSSKLD